MAPPTALQLYKHLPKTNCGRCGEKTCMAYALKLLERKVRPEDCLPLSKEQLTALKEAITPAVKEARFADRIVGGEEVMFRHELRFFSPPPIFLDVSDTMPKEDIRDTAKFVSCFEVERVGTKLSIDGLAIRCKSGDPKKFVEAIKTVLQNFTGPLVLCSLTPEILSAGLVVAGPIRPLLYAATEDNWEKMLALAKKYDTAVALHSPTTEGLISLSRKFTSKGFENIVLDPGITDIADTVNRFTLIRKAAVDGVPELRHPLMAAAASIWLGSEKNEMKSFTESNTAAMLMMRYASLMILHTDEAWAILPLLTLRQNIYSDPRIEASVEPKLYELGSPNKDSPVLLTTNFALTYYNVSDDLKKTGISSYLLVLDTEGLAATVAVAADKVTPATIKAALSASKVTEKVRHRKLIIPGVMASLSEAVARETGWEILIGPQDSSQLKDYLEKRWIIR
jgi:acetyl-CoA decarbonylase/synthase complex subunit gamma